MAILSRTHINTIRQLNWDDGTKLSFVITSDIDRYVSKAKLIGASVKTFKSLTILKYTDEVKIVSNKTVIIGLGVPLNFKDSNFIEIDFTNTDSSKLKTMIDMFKGCNRLEKLNLKNLDTSNVDNMYNTFSGCTNLKELDLSSFNTSKVTTMRGLFHDCRSLTEIDISNFDTSKVLDLASMFQYCISLEKVVINKLDVGNTTDMSCMFSNCYKLKHINLDIINGYNIRNTTGMFNNCNSLMDLDISALKSKKLLTSAMMFSGCKSLEKIDMGNVLSEDLEDTFSMFLGCIKLRVLNIGNIKLYTGLYSNIENTLKGCEDLEEIHIGSADEQAVNKIMREVDSLCHKLKKIVVKDYDTAERFREQVKYYSYSHEFMKSVQVIWEYGETVG